MTISSEEQQTASKALLAYFDSRSSGPAAPLRLGRRVVHRTIPTSRRLGLRRLLTRVVGPRERYRAKQLATAAPLRLNLGCATSPLDGWINVDLVGDGPDLAWDLDSPLPFGDGTVDAIFHEHLLEHFDLTAAVAFLREHHRLLASGGVLRIGVPDAGAYLRAYGDPQGSFISAARPGRPTQLLAVQELFYDHGHQSAYDFETLALLLAATGFHSIERRSFGDSSLDPCPDGAHRQLETLYVEARR